MKKLQDFKNGDTIATIFGESAIIINMGKYRDELTKLDRDIQIGFYNDGVPCYSCYIETEELYQISKRVGE